MSQQQESLITSTEADEVVAVPQGVAAKLRIPLMIILGSLLIVAATLLVMIIFSLKGSRTGWEAILPFLDSKSVETLRTN